MGWEKRKSKMYFYLHQRLPDGRKKKQYYGHGFDAKMTHHFLMLRQVERTFAVETFRQLKAVTQEADELLNSYCKGVSELVAVEMLAAGFHNSRSRGWRKIMTTELNEMNEGAETSTVSASTKSRRSKKGSASREDETSKPTASQAKQEKKGSGAPSNGATVTSPLRSAPRTSKATAKALRTSAEQFRMELDKPLFDKANDHEKPRCSASTSGGHTAAAAATQPIGNAGDSENSDTGNVESPPPAKPVEEMNKEELITAAKRGNKEALSLLRPLMQKDANRYQMLGDLGLRSREKWLDVHCKEDLYLRECLGMHLKSKRAALLAEGNSPIEQLLIEEVLGTWLRHTFWITFDANSIRSNPGSKALKFGMEQTRAAQRMYLKALAELRDSRNARA